MKEIPKELVLIAYPRILRAAFRWISIGALQYLATAVTEFAISGLVDKAIHKERRTDQLSEKKQNIRLVNIKISKPPSC